MTSYSASKTKLKKMKLKLALPYLSRALPFSNLSREATTARAKTIENGVRLKYLTTASDAKFATLKTSVWWDFENCMVPRGCDGHKIALNIKSALEKHKYCGPVAIYAYGDTNKISSSVQRALVSTGVSLNHVPPGVKDGSDKKIFVDMLMWAMENREPANIMLISGDGDYSYVLHRLRMMGYNVILVRPDNASHFLIASANTIWLWRSIVAGGSGSEVTKQAEPSKRMNSVLAVKSKSSSSEKHKKKATLVASESAIVKSKSRSSEKHKKKATLVASQSAIVKQKTMWCTICEVHYPTNGHEKHNSGRRHKNKLQV